MSKKPDDEQKGPSPKWLDGNQYENAGKAKKHENRLASRLGGKRYAGSGNRRWSKWVGSSDTDKGDIATPEMHFEHKFTRDASISLKLEWLDKVKEGARKFHKDPGMIITFEDSHGKPKEEWAILPLTVFEQLIRKVRDSKE